MTQEKEKAAGTAKSPAPQPPAQFSAPQPPAFQSPAPQPPAFQSSAPQSPAPQSSAPQSQSSAAGQLTAQALIEKLGLEPLPLEGGMTMQTYVSAFQVDGAAAGTAIYYLLSGDAFSHLHRLSGDEMYHFYLGDPVELLELLPDGTAKTTILGQDVAGGQQVQHLVPAGNWQGSRLADGGEFALLGTTMWPGYTQECYEHGDAGTLRQEYPQWTEAIDRLTGTAKYK